ncbi:galactokinase family protein [uncultured Ruminococcus sp.]|uniref:galactokinase n=1 Tax=uncultured Ruminococcus sp. TaxID=165186 RepID=UPI00292D6A83|nr:galactokinase family protein [uncultured Ruminococcus sp.]
MKAKELINQLNNSGLKEELSVLYGADASVLYTQRHRYSKAIERFTEIFPEREDVHLFSAPGRSEIGGNHTDHQRGCALGAAVNLDIVAVVAFHDEGVIRLYSEGYGMTEIDLSDLDIHENEKGKSIGIVRGIAARFAQMGVKIGGFDAYSVSDVLSGSGLSSSAAFETLIGTIIDVQYNDGKAGEIEIAKIGQYAENVYFGKGSGLLDQMVCSVGGFVFLDFRDAEQPVVEKHSFDFAKAGYNLCITDTKGSHSDLTDDYVAVPSEMKQVAAQFGKEVLREVDEKEFFQAIPALRGKCSDRAILRAMHFFGENNRAIAEADALDRGDPERFFTLYHQSADSSANLLQNLYATKKPLEQGIPLAIAVSKSVLGNDASVRVHGGGFAGTIQAFVPLDQTEAYREKMDALFGAGSCYVLRIRPVGGVKIV